MVAIMSRLKLTDVEWDSFKLKELFSVKRGKRHIEKNRIKGEIPYYSASSANNGVTDFISNPLFIDCDKLIVSTFCDSFFAKGDFTASDEMTLFGNKSMNLNSALFISKCINSNSGKYTFGRKAFSERLKEQIIFIPIDSNNEPNWQFMEDYIKQEQKIQAQKIIDYYEQKMIETAFGLVGLEDVKWKTFDFTELFREIKRGKRLRSADHIDGNVPYVSSTGLNNGVDSFIGNTEGIRSFKDNLSLANSGSVGSCFYHFYEYIASDHVTGLTLENPDKNIYLFMSTVIKRISEKYSFSREINDQRIKREKIMLPSDSNGNPHWDYMGKFMQNIEMEKLSKALEYIYIYKLAISRELLLGKLDEVEWKEFWIEDILKVSSGVRLTKENQQPGKRPFIGATEYNNGITSFVDNINASLDSNVLGVNYNGSVVENFYHPYECIFSDDVKRLSWLDESVQNRYTYLFLKQCILQQKVKYAYGYKFNATRMKRQKIVLPVDKDGTPNYSYMKEYMQIQEIKEQYRTIDFYKSSLKKCSYLQSI